MNKLDTGRWQVLSPLLDELLDADATTRAERLRELHLTDGELATELAGLIERCQRVEAARFLEPTAAPNTVIGSYRLVRELGQGGMGAVWLAERNDGRYEGQAAIKFLHLGLADATGRERFHREGNALARLNHPNIARLFDSGVTPEGQPFLVLEYVAGEPIDRWCEAHQLSVDARIRLMLQVLQAVEHAHGRLILHRDLKPANILVSAEGRVKLLDFGIAKLLTDDNAQAVFELTAINGRLFTLDYASPEQVKGEEVTMASDVYSLGVILYGLLTGQHPTAGDTQTPIARMRAILECEPQRPSEVPRGLETLQEQQRMLRTDLDWIVLKALKVDVAQRYASVTAFADDLRRYLSSETVMARPDSAWYRTRKFIARNRVGVVAAASIVVALTVGLFSSLSQLQVARAERQRAEQVKDFIASIFRDADPFQIGGDVPVTAAELLSCATRRVEAELGSQPGIGMELLYTIGDSQLALGRVADAKVTFQKLLARSQGAAPSTLYAAAAQRGLADVELRAGRMTAAQQRLTPAIADLRGAGAVGTRLLFDTLLLQARIHRENNALDAAMTTAGQALALARTRFGTAGESTLRAAAMLGDLQVRALRYREAVATLRPLLESADGASHAVLADLNVAYGTALVATGDAPDGVRRLRQAVAYGKAAYGAGTDQAAEYTSYLANTLERLGDLDGAITAAQDALAAATSPLKQAEMRGILGAYLVHAGRQEQAVPVLKQAAEELRQHSPESILLPNVVARYGQALAKTDPAAAEQALLGNLTTTEPHALSQTRAGLGLIALRRGDLAASQSWFEQAVAARTPVSPDVLAALGQLQLAQGKLLEAERSLQQAEALFRGTTNASMPRVADVLLTRGQVAMARGDREVARKLFSESVQFWRGFAPSNPAALEAAEWQRRAQR